jgi:hypothetical protein
LQLLPFGLSVFVQIATCLVISLKGLLLNREQLDRVVSLDTSPGDGLYERAFENFLVAAKGQSVNQQRTGTPLQRGLPASLVSRIR